MKDIPSREELTLRLTDKAMKDTGFRHNLIDSPGETIGKELGVTFPSTVRIQVVEETPTTFYLVLPCPPTKEDQELTARELQNIAAGGLDSDFWSAVYTRMNCIY